MNKRGFTILELLISILLISIVLLLLLRVMMSLETINHDTSYASDDEIARAEIIRNVESDFLEYHLNGLEIVKGSDRTTLLFMMDEEKRLVIKNDSITYDDEVYTLKSSWASYSLCVNYEYFDLENDYYLVKIVIPVLIDGKNNTRRDDLELTFLGLKNELTSFDNNYAC